MGIVELSPDVYLISSTHHGTPGTAALHTLAMRSYDPADPTSITVTPTLSLPRALFLNGACVLPTAPPSVLLADSYTASLYRAGALDLDHARPARQDDRRRRVAGRERGQVPRRVRGRHEQRSAGVRADPRRRGRARVAAPGPPEVLVRGTLGDDVVVDPAGTVACVATNPNNSLSRIRVEGEGERGFETVAGGSGGGCGRGRWLVRGGGGRGGF